MTLTAIIVFAYLLTPVLIVLVSERINRKRGRP